MANKYILGTKLFKSTLPFLSLILGTATFVKKESNSLKLQIANINGILPN